MKKMISSVIRYVTVTLGNQQTVNVQC